MDVFQKPIPKEYATMAESTTASLTIPEWTAKDVMTEVLQKGAQQMLTQAIQEEVEEWISQRAELRNENGRHQVVRNGYLPKRTITTGIGPVEVQQPRVSKDRDVLLTFYDFPAEHWIHLRTTNPIESTFATVRLRTKRTKGCGTRTACLTMVFKLMQSAQKRWRTFNGSERIPDVIQGIPFINGVKQPKAAA